MTLIASCGAGNAATPAPGPPVFDAVVNLGPMVNSQDFEGGPSISADGLELYFTSDRAGSNGGDIWMARRTSTAEPFAQPLDVGPTVNSSSDEGAPSISSDGLELFFDRSPDGHIFAAHRSTVSELFGPPVLLDLGNPGCCDGFPDISYDGLDLYFCSTRPGGHGGADVWRASRNTRSSAFGPPQNLGPTVNTATDDCDPAISKDGLTLFIASDRKDGFGALDVWVSTRANRSAQFGRPTNLGGKFNSHFTDERPNLAPDGTLLLFMSNRPGGSGFFDLWQATRANR